MHQSIENEVASQLDGEVTVQSAHDQGTVVQSEGQQPMAFSIKVMKKPVPSTPRGVLAE